MHKRAAIQRCARALVLALLFAVLAALELFPILTALRFDRLWILSNAENFTWSFWPPLKPELHHSYFFFQVGMLYWTVLIPIHWATAWILHSKVATIQYMQVFGYLVEILFSGLTLALAGFVLITKRLSWMGKAIVLFFMVYMRIATYDIFELYQMNIGPLLDYKLLQAVALVLLVIQLERSFSGEQHRGQFHVLTGILAGLLLFDVPIYEYLALFLIANILATTSLSSWPATLLKVAASAGIASAALLWTFYRGDVSSILAAVHAQAVGLAYGFPQGQPGFREEFFDKALRLTSGYFLHQMFYVAGIVLAVGLAFWFVRRPAADRRPGYDAALLRLSLVYLFALLMHLNVMRTHGSYTVVFSGVFLTLLYLLLSLLVIVHRGGLRTNPMFAVAAAGTLGLLLIFAPIYNLSLFGLKPRFGLSIGPTSFRTASSTHASAYAAVPSNAMRMYDRFLNEMDSKFTLEVNPNLYPADCLVAWQYTMAEGWVAAGSGIPGFVADARYAGMFQRERYPAWRIHFPDVIREAEYHAGSFRVKEVQNPVGRVDTTWLIPLDAALGEQLIRARERQVTWVDYAQSRGRAHRTLVEGYPKVALYELNVPWEPRARAWFVLPLTLDEATKLGPHAAAAMEAGYLPFIGSLCRGDAHHLLLIDGKNSVASQAVANSVTASVRAQQAPYWAKARALAQAVRTYYAAHRCYPSWTDAGIMPVGLAPYVNTGWPQGYHYLAQDMLRQGAGSRSTAHYVGVAANVLGLDTEDLETVWIVDNRPVPVC